MAEQLDFNILVQSDKAIHQFTLREIREITTHHAGHVRLRDAYALCSFWLHQARAAHGATVCGDDPAGADRHCKMSTLAVAMT